MEGANDALTEFVSHDTKDAELADYLDATSTKHPYHYRPFTGGSGWKPQVEFGAVSGDDTWPNAIRAALCNQHNQSPYECRMGIFPEIHRAWAALRRVDATGYHLDLVLWDYEHGNAGEACPLYKDRNIVTIPLTDAFTNWGGDPRYAGLTAIGLVVPKSDLVVTTNKNTTVKYLLVVACTEEVRVFSLSFDSSSRALYVHGYQGQLVRITQEAGVYSEEAQPLVRLPTDGVRFDAIAGTQHGRIFLGGSDGSLHELVLAGSMAAASVRLGLAGGVAVAATEFVVDTASGVASWAKRRALDAIALNAKSDPSVTAKLVNHGIPMLQSLLAAVLGTLPSAGYPIVDLSVDHERGYLVCIALDGRMTMWKLGPAGDELVMTACVGDLDAACRQFIAEGDAGNKPPSDLFQPSRARNMLHARGDYPGQPLLGLSSVLSYFNSTAVATPLPVAWPAVSVSVVRQCDSKRVHVVVTTASGARLYFTTYTKEHYATLASGVTLPSGPFAEPPKDAQEPGCTLRLTYIRLPPPFITTADIGKSAQNPRTDGYEPSGSGGSSSFLPLCIPNRQCVAVSGQHMMVATPSLNGAAASSGYGVVAINRDYLKRKGVASSLSETDGQGVGWGKLPFAESVAVFDVRQGISAQPVAIAEILPEADYVLDPVFSPSGAFILPNGDTAPMPKKAWDIRRGLGCVLEPPATAGVSVTAVSDPRIGTKRKISADASEQALSPHVGAVIAQAGLTDSGAPEQYGHILRRRLWDAAPAYGVPQAPFSLQHDVRSSASGWVVLDRTGISRLYHVRPIDQVAFILSRANLAPSAYGMGSSVTVAPLHDAVFDDLRAWVPIAADLFSIVAGVACNVLDVSMQGVQPYPPPRYAAGRPAAWSIGASAGCADAAARHASEIMRLNSKPSWDPDSATLTKHDIRYSPAVAGLFMHIARTLRPFWETSLFISPPQDTVHKHLPSGVVRIGAKKVGLSGSLVGQAGVEIQAGILLPRFTSAECIQLSRRLTAVAEFMRTFFPVVSSFEPSIDPSNRTKDRQNALHTAAREVGMEAEFGFEESATNMQQGAASVASLPEAARIKRSLHMEALYVLLVYRLVVRAAEAASLMAAVADPSFYAASVLYNAGGKNNNKKAGDLSKPGTGAVASSVIGVNGASWSDAELVERVSGQNPLSWWRLVVDPVGLNFADALFSRMIQALRVKAGTKKPSGAVVPGPSLTPGRPAGFGVSRAILSASSLAPGGASTQNGSQDDAERLAQYLRDRCPSFFSEGNRLKVAAASLAEQAARSTNATERAEFLRQSEEHGVQAVRNLAAAGLSATGPSSLLASINDFEALCSSWRSLGSPSSAIRLMADVAEAIAGGRSAVPTLPEDAPTSGNGAALSVTTQARMRCYTAIVEAIDAVTLANPTSSALNAQLWTNLLAQALDRPDALLHDTVYRWLEEVNRAALLSLASPFLEYYLTRRSGDRHNNLLVEFYRRRNQHGKAARHLHDLANSRSLPAQDAGAPVQTSLDIFDRLKFLTEAIQEGARSAGTVMTGSQRGSSDAETITAAELSLWEEYLRMFNAQRLLATGLKRLEAAKERSLNGAGAPDGDLIRLQADARTASYEIMALQGIWDSADANRLLDACIAVLDVKRRPDTLHVLNTLYTRIIQSVIDAVQQGTLDRLEFAQGHNDVLLKLGLPLQSTQIPPAYATKDSVIGALQVVVESLVVSFHPELSPSWAFPTTHIIASLEQQAFEGKWLVDEGIPLISNAGWVSVKALSRLDWTERHFAYREWYYATVRRQDASACAHLALAWSELVRAWSAAAQKESSAARSLQASLGDAAGLAQNMLDTLNTPHGGSGLSSDVLRSVKAKLSSLLEHELASGTSFGSSQFGSGSARPRRLGTSMVGGPGLSASALR